MRHNHINDIIWCALTRAHIPASKEPSGLSRSDGKRPDGLTLIPWKSGRSAIWDVTVCDTLAMSYVGLTSIEAGSAAEGAASKKMSKYLDLSHSYEFFPVAFETLRPVNSVGSNFISNIGKAMTLASRTPRESSFVWQRLSIALQKHNAICFKQSFTSPILELLSSTCVA